MSLASRISDLATAIANEFNSVRDEKISGDGSITHVVAVGPGQPITTMPAVGDQLPGYLYIQLEE